MIQTPPTELRSGLATAYSVTHDHLRYILQDLTPEQVAREPTPNARTIIYYLHHLINTELYWLSTTGRKVEQYPKAVPFNVAVKLLDDVKDRVLQELKDCKDEELVFAPPTEKSKPSLGWIVGRITLHALYHSGEIIYTRYSVGGSNLPSDESEESWARMINAVAHLIFFTKQKD